MMTTKKILSIFLSVLLLMMAVPSVPISAAGSPGQIELDKTSVMTGDREYTVTLTVDGNGLTNQQPTDIVLVLDVSLSMNTALTGSKTRLQVLKEAATTFVSTVLPAGSSNRVAVVEYSTDVTGSGSTRWNDGRIVQAFSSSASTVNSAINGLNGEAYTNMEAGFYHADIAMDSARAGVNKFVIYMTDGVPNRYYDSEGRTQGSGSGFSTTAASQAIGAAKALKVNHPGTKIFTIGLVNDDPGGQIASVLNPPSPDNYPEAYYQVTTAGGLSSIYQYLSQVILQIATDAVVTDVIEEGFSYIPGSLAYPAGTTAAVTGTPATEEVVTWTIGTVTDELLTLTFKVRADDPVYGGAFTNESAEITFKPVPENTYYTPGPDGFVGLDFPQPVVPVPPIAVDDAYTVNSGSTLVISVPGVLVNDVSVDQRADGGWTSTPISGSVSVVTQPTNGSLTQNTDGSFTYTPNAGFSGIDTYVYKIFTDVTVAGGSTTRLEDTATVTITVIPAYIIRVHKTDAVSGDPLANVTFALYNEAKTDVLETLPATGADGYAQTASTYSTGTYYLKETAVPNGYNLDPTFYPVTIASGSGVITVDVANQRTPYPIGVFKVDDTSNAPLSGVVFGLFSDLGATSLLETLAATDVNGYAQTASTYAPGTYYLKESAPAGGYLTNSAIYPVIVNLGQTGGIATITVTNKKINLIDIPVTKTWVDDSNAQSLRPTNGITVRLLRKLAADPAPVEIAEQLVTGTGNIWTHLFTGLLETDADGNPYIYSITEDAVINYATSIDGFAITNTLTGTVNIPVTKTWNDDEDADGLRPGSITVNLWRSVDPSLTSPELVEARLIEESVIPGWNFSFTGLAKYDSQGRLYYYFITENAVANYQTAINGFAITNTLTGTTDITVTKTWVDSNNIYGTRPLSVSVSLMRKIAADASSSWVADGILAPDAWTAVFNGLPKYDSLGRKFIYSITETPVTNYTSVIVGFAITNTLDTVDITVTKAWADDDNAAGLRPTFVTVQLLRNGAPFLEPVQITGNPDWTHTFEDLPAKDGSGQPFAYSVQESTAVLGYETTYNQETLTITNTLVKHRIQVIKLDQRDESTRLAGAVFELRSAIMEGQIPTVGSLLETLTTDAAGQATTTNLYAPGLYFLVEKTPPAGYLLLSDPILMVMAPDGQFEDNGTFVVRVINNFDNNPAITISKLAANLTRGGVPAELSELYVGETARYTLTITNTGNAPLVNVTLTDDKAAAGSTIRNVTTSTDLVWAAGPGGKATVSLGALAAGASVTLTYNRVTTAADLESDVITNTASVTGSLMPTPDYPNGTTVTSTDTAAITVEALPLAGLSIQKQVQNITRGGSLAELSGGYPGDIFRFAVMITNNGAQKLTGVTLTDSRATVGSTVRNETAGVDKTWIAGTGGIATLNIGDLLPGQSIIFSYFYTSTSADMNEVLVNTAILKGTPTVTVGDPVAITVQDTAAITVEEIPKTGESGSPLSMIGLSLLLGAAALVLFRKRHTENGAQVESTPDDI